MKGKVYTLEIHQNKKNTISFHYSHIFKLYEISVKFHTNDALEYKYVGPSGYSVKTDWLQDKFVYSAVRLMFVNKTGT